MQKYSTYLDGQATSDDLRWLTEGDYVILAWGDTGRETAASGPLRMISNGALALMFPGGLIPVRLGDGEPSHQVSQSAEFTVRVARDGS